MKTILRKKYGTKFLLHHICIRVSPIVNNKRKPLLWICNEKKSRTWFVYAKFSKILQVDFHEIVEILMSMLTHVEEEAWVLPNVGRFGSKDFLKRFSFGKSK